MPDSTVFDVRRRTVAVADIEAVEDGLRELRTRFRFSEAGPMGPSPITARQALVDELLEYLEARRVR